MTVGPIMFTLFPNFQFQVNITHVSQLQQTRRFLYPDCVAKLRAGVLVVKTAWLKYYANNSVSNQWPSRCGYPAMKRALDRGPWNTRMMGGGSYMHIQKPVTSISA